MCVWSCATHIQDTWSKKRRLTDEQTLKTDADPDAMAVKFDSAWSEHAAARAAVTALVPPSTPSGSAPGTPQVFPPTALSENGKVALQGIRKSHGAWDRVKKEWAAAVMQSKENENTQGCKVAADLEELIKEGQKHDDAMAHIELKLLSYYNCTDEEIKQIGEEISNLTLLIKNGAKKVTGLKTLFRL